MKVREVTQQCELLMKFQFPRKTWKLCECKCDLDARYAIDRTSEMRFLVSNKLSVAIHDSDLYVSTNGQSPGRI